MMQSLGYTDLVLSLDFRHAGFDTGADTFTLRSFALDVADVGKLAITGAFSNVKVHGMVEHRRRRHAGTEARRRASTR